jgi:hypothetical protein
VRNGTVRAGVLGVERSTVIDSAQFDRSGRGGGRCGSALQGGPNRGRGAGAVSGVVRAVSRAKAAGNDAGRIWGCTGRFWRLTRRGVLPRARGGGGGGVGAVRSTTPGTRSCSRTPSPGWRTDLEVRVGAAAADRLVQSRGDRGPGGRGRRSGSAGRVAPDRGSMRSATRGWLALLERLGRAHRPFGLPPAEGSRSVVADNEQRDKCYAVRSKEPCPGTVVVVAP